MYHPSIKICMCYEFTNQITYSQQLTHNYESTVSFSLYTERLTTCVSTNTTQSDFLTSILVLLYTVLSLNLLKVYLQDQMYSYTTCIHYRISTLYNSGPSHNHTTILYGKTLLQITRIKMWVQSVKSTYSARRPLTLWGMVVVDPRYPSLSGDGSKNFYHV